MVVLDDSKENFIVNVPEKEVADLKQREEERKRTGRNLAVIVVLLIIVLCIYQTVSHVASQVSALISAAIIMFLYLLSLWYAAERRKRKQKKDDIKIEQQVSTVLEKLSNIRQMQSTIVNQGAHDNYVFTHTEEETDEKKNGENWTIDMEPCGQGRTLKKQVSMDYSRTNYGRPKTLNEELNHYDGSEVFIRTYSVG